MIWLLEKSTLDAISTDYTMTADEQAQFAAAFSGSGAANGDRVMTVENGVATIKIAGVLTTSPSFMAMFFGGGNTLFGDVHAAIDAAERNDNVKSITFRYATPGGEAHPTVILGDRMSEIKKPHKAVVDAALSAGYWLASQADTIEATSRVARVGSIGVVGGYVKPSESYVAEVTSTKAPNKRPNPETDEGIAAIRVELDELHELFAVAVASGRNTTEKKVNNDFGKGGVLLAAKALNVGMIDSIADGGTMSKTKDKPKPTGAINMDLETLKAEHPALFASVIAQGQKEGAAGELDRVKFHLTLGSKVGATDTAIDACLKGTAKDCGETQALYLSASANKSDLDARAQDEADLQDNTPAGAQTEEQTKAAAIDDIFAQAFEKSGIEA